MHVASSTITKPVLISEASGEALSPFNSLSGHGVPVADYLTPADCRTMSSGNLEGFDHPDYTSLDSSWQAAHIYCEVHVNDHDTGQGVSSPKQDLCGVNNGATAEEVYENVLVVESDASGAINQPVGQAATSCGAYPSVLSLF